MLTIDQPPFHRVLAAVPAGLLACLLASAIPDRLAAQASPDAHADSIPIPASARALFDSLHTAPLGPGAWHASGSISRGPFRVHVIAARIDDNLTLETVRGGEGLVGRARTTELAREWAERAGDGIEVVAAVNADFFIVATGEQLASQVTGGEVIKARASAAASGPDAFTHAQLLLDESGAPHILHAEYAGSVLAGGRHIALDAVNALPGGYDGVVLLDSRWMRPFPFDSLPGEAATLPLRAAGAQRDTLLFVRDTAPGVGSIEAPGQGQATLVASGTAIARLALLAGTRDTLRVVHRFAPVGERVRTLVGGRPALLAAGTFLGNTDGSFPHVGHAFAVDRHPRTAVGISADRRTVYLVTVDGRQEESVGMTLVELAELMVALGSVDVLNLDGGGSTTAVVGGRVVNSPSDPGGERTVGNAILLVRRAVAQPASRP